MASGSRRCGASKDLLEEAKRRELDSFAAADVARKSDANRRNNLAQLASGRVEVIDILESDALESPWWRRADRRQDTLAQIAAGATVFELDYIVNSSAQKLGGFRHHSWATWQLPRI